MQQKFIHRIRTQLVMTKMAATDNEEQSVGSTYNNNWISDKQIVR